MKIPKEKYLESIELYSETGMRVDKRNTSKELIYTLIGKEINLINSFFNIFEIGNQYFNEHFSLSQLGLQVLPQYFIRLKNNENNIRQI